MKKYNSAFFNILLWAARIISVAYIFYFMFFKEHTKGNPADNILFILLVILFAGSYNIPIRHIMKK